MPVPSNISELSTTPGSNSPAGSESPATFDDYMRTFAAFIAQLRDGKQATGQAVLLSGAQTAAGVKTFTDGIISNVTGNLTGNASGLSTTLAVSSGGTGTTDGSNLYQTGDIMFKARNSNAPGWLKLNGNSIGNASSGATARANADAEALFIHLWNEYSNAVLIIQTSAGAPTTRGASGAADFAANKRMPLFDARGDVFRSLDEGKGVDPARVGGTEQFDAFQDHAHTVVRTSDGLALQVGAYSLSAGGTGIAVLGTGSDGFQARAVATSGGGTPRTASETRMRNLAFPAFIKL